MKYAEINKRFADKVAEWLSRGYHFNSNTMGGSQGEIAKVDLTDGNDIIRIYLESKYEWDNADVQAYDYVQLVVGRVITGRVHPDCNNGGDTIWTSELEVVEQERFYKIGRMHRDREYWYGSKEAAKEQAKKQMQRAMARRVDTWKDLGDKAKKIVLPYIRRQYKCKFVRLDQIIRVRHDGAKYFIDIDKGKYKLDTYLLCKRQGC